MALVEDSQAFVLIADYAAADTAGKLNIIGAGFQLVNAPGGVFPSPHTVLVVIDVPQKYAGDQCAVSIELRNETTGSPVKVPTGPAGKLDTLRVSQSVDISAPALGPGITVPRDVPCKIQIALAMPPGLPLQPNSEFAWRLSIDGTHKKGWEARFWTLSGPTPPVFGGPSGPADIPNVQL
jgi:hypothetical protein